MLGNKIMKTAIKIFNFKAAFLIKLNKRIRTYL